MVDAADREMDGPLVPPELVPHAVRPARGTPAPRLAVAGVVAAVLVAVAVVGLAGWRWYSTSLLGTALAGVEAAVSGDVAALEPLLLRETAATDAFRAARAAGTRDPGVSFGAPAWSGGWLSPRVDVAFTHRGAREHFTLRPALDALGEAALTWSGPPFGDGEGRVVLLDEAGGWRLYAVGVGGRGVSFDPQDAARSFRAPAPAR